MQEGILDLADFIEITGLEVEDEQIAAFNRANARATKYLEQLLGWSFSYKEAYTEIAKSKNPNKCPTEEQLEQWQNNPEEYNYFDEPDTASGYYKLLPFYIEDSNYMIDPATAVYSVKIVKVVSGDNNQFITIKTLKPDDWNQKVISPSVSGRSPIIKWLELCKAPDQLPCECKDERSCYMLAVDADWVKRLSDELKYLISDLILYYIKHPMSLSAATAEYAVKSESVDGHSVSYDTSIQNKNATLEGIVDLNSDLIKRYIGPFSPLNKKLKVY